MGQAMKRKDGIDRGQLRREFESLLQDSVQDMRPLRPRRGLLEDRYTGFRLTARGAQVSRAGQEGAARGVGR